MSRGGSFPCSFALELQRQRAFGGVFFRALLFPIPVFTCPLSFTRFPAISRSELKKRKYALYITDGNMSIYLKLYVRYENSGLRFRGTTFDHSVRQAAKETRMLRKEWLTVKI